MTRVAVVTGANKGIGYAIVKGLAQQFDGIIYLTARNESLGHQALDQIKTDVPANLKLCREIRYHQLDIADDQSIKRLKEYLKSEHGGLDILVNNAAFAYKETASEPFGEQAANTIAVNYTGTKKVCEALFPLLKPHARVVNVSSTLGLYKYLSNDAIKDKLISPALTEGDIESILNDFIKYAEKGTHTDHGFPSIYSAYSMSKVGLTALSILQQRQFDKEGRNDVIVNACCPGFVATDLNDNRGHLTPDQGAETPIYLALLPQNIDEPKGKFVSKKQIVDVLTGNPI